MRVIVRLILQYLAETLPTDQFYQLAFGFVFAIVVIAVVCLVCFAA